MLRASWVLVVPLAVGCANARATRTADSDTKEDSFEVTCRESQENCHAKAREVCGPGYQVVDSSGRYDQGNEASFYSGRLLIRCDKTTAE